MRIAALAVLLIYGTAMADTVPSDRPVMIAVPAGRLTPSDGTPPIDLPAGSFLNEPGLAKLNDGIKAEAADNATMRTVMDTITPPEVLAKAILGALTLGFAAGLAVGALTHK